MNGDGGKNRDFCYIQNALQASLLAATTKNPAAVNQVYNVAIGDRTWLNNLYKLIAASLARHCQLPSSKLRYRAFRAGDVRHSRAEICKAQTLLGYAPTMKVGAGITAEMPWYVSTVGRK